MTISRHCCAEETNLDNYRGIVDEALLDEIKTLSRKLSGLRVCHVNATAEGGGVAEFFQVTKSFHNGLQGADIGLTPEIEREYLNHNELGAAELDDSYDVCFVHDPQPAASACGKFLLPRLVRDELRLLAEVAG